MSNYNQTVNFTAKDSLPSGDAAKVIKGSDYDLEFGAVQTAVNSKSDSANGTHTGTTSVESLDISGNVSGGTIDGGTW